MIKEFLKNSNENKFRQLNNYKILEEKGVSDLFVKIYDQKNDETKILYDYLNPCIIMEAGQINLDQLFKN